jgi:Flp pilus assembly pilin Flp
MRHPLAHVWHETDGVLSFEWTMLLTLLVLGVVGGLAGARDAVIDELGDVAQAMLALDHSYELDSPLELLVDIDGAGGPAPPVEVGAAAGSEFIDAQVFQDCGRSAAIPGEQTGQTDSDS